MQEYMLSTKVLMLYGGVWNPSEFYVSIDDTFLPPGNDGYGLGKVLSGIRKQDPGQVWNVDSSVPLQFILDGCKSATAHHQARSDYTPSFRSEQANTSNRPSGLYLRHFGPFERV
jgi:hypothetical protein